MQRLPTLKLNEQLLIVERTGIACNRTEGRISILGCGLGYGILVV